MQYVSEHKSDTSLMLLQPMFTQYLKKLQKQLKKIAFTTTENGCERGFCSFRFFQAPYQDLITSENGKTLQTA